MSTPAPKRVGCSPWTIMGCGCGLVAIVGIALVFLVLGFLYLRERRDASWSKADYALCQQHLVYLGRAIASYERDHHRLPPTFADLQPQYLPTGITCPLEHKGTSYTYHADARTPDSAMVTCPNHGQGPLILQRNGQIRWKSTLLGKRK